MDLNSAIERIADILKGLEKKREGSETASLSQ
jgi:hypothetical protein